MDSLNVGFLNHSSDSLFSDVSHVKILLQVIV
jgi:hypothetical protein